MFKSFSIKSLLKLWSLGTVLAIVVMAIVSIYINAIFSDKQLELTQKSALMQGLSLQVSNIATLLAEEKNNY